MCVTFLSRSLASAAVGYAADLAGRNQGYLLAGGVSSCWSDFWVLFARIPRLKAIVHGVEYLFGAFPPTGAVNQVRLRGRSF
jgi:hypothetical protein